MPTATLDFYFVARIMHCISENRAPEPTTNIGVNDMTKVQKTDRALEIISGIIKTGIALALLASLTPSANAETYHAAPPANAITKFEAMRVSFNNPKATIYKCAPVRITEKGTLKNIPASGSNNFVVPPTEEEKAAVKGVAK
jgi:hypothetical protein